MVGSKLSAGCSSSSTSGVSSMTHSSESSLNGSCQNSSISCSSAGTSLGSSSSGQVSTDSDSSGSGPGCSGSVGSGSPPCRNHVFSSTSGINDSHSHPDSAITNNRQGIISNSQVVVTRAVININSEV